MQRLWLRPYAVAKSARWLILVAAAPLGCSISRDEYDRMSARARALNETSGIEAMEQLRQQGYSPLEPATYRAQASTTTEGIRRCALQAHQAPAATEGDAPFDPEEALPVELAGKTSLKVTARALDGCRFLAGAGQQLRVKKADGSELVIYRWAYTDGIAKDRNGNPVLFSLDPEVETKKMMVRESCNFMPSPSPPIWELRGPFGGPHVDVSFVPKPARHVHLPVHQIELEYNCTDRSD